ncbi:LacI family DNA-binding transcriptional regulator [Chitinibacter sp. ZOR0017]|uniref:LacI family DNA-binding transcriptional regulator n=1 Tax=Chitinibacter sp. ZOR0017 TaxID=1339254 RepID=UPI000646B7CD|nr:LacI family DNA-binding transcriptional regulator [Chitinibacter sp. ZOR0017]
MTISMRALAAAVGVSVGTVSRALKHQGGVSPETRQRVFQQAAALGYDLGRLEPAPLRKVLFLLHSQHTRSSAVPFYSAVEQGARDVCTPMGIELQPFTVKHSSSIRRQLLLQEADAILAVGFLEPETLAIAQALGKPMTLIDSSAPGLPSVNPDNLAGTQALTAQLLAQGYQRIAFLCGSLAHYSIRLRERGYRQALFNAGRLADPALEGLIPPGLDLAAGVQHVLRQWLAGINPPDAIIAYNDACALEVLRQLRSHGIRVPQQIAVAGFDNIPSAADAGLTTVAVDQAALGISGMRQLLELARHQATRDSLHAVRVLQRASTTR